MNVGELLDYLARQPRERPVVLAADAEGNGHSPLAAADEGIYYATSVWSGEVYYPEDDEMPPASAVPAVILGPRN